MATDREPVPSPSPPWLERATDLLEKEWGPDRACPYCQATEWTVNTRLIGLPRLDGLGVYPMVAVGCSTCGNTVLLNAYEVGLLVPGEDLEATA
jgi:hypothetical protein